VADQQFTVLCDNASSTFGWRPSLIQCAVYSRYLLLGYIIVGGLAYFAGLRLLRAIHPSDVQLVNQFLGKRYEPLINLFSKLLQTKW
jgi:hypothetical protein